MKLKIITVATRNDIGLDHLKESCEKYNLDFQVVGMDRRWKGFGTKIILTREYLKTLTDYTHFVFVDAYDVIFLGNKIEEVYKENWNDKIVFSAEKNCWPDPNLSSQYPQSQSVWKYLNSGSYIAPIDKYLELTDKYVLEHTMDDQLYFTKIYLDNNDIVLDTDCKLFQSIAFCGNTEFDTTEKLINNWTNTRPIIVHGNGKTNMSVFYEILNRKSMNSLGEVSQIWNDIPETHVLIHEEFKKKVDAIPELKMHRDFVEQNMWGFGERSFLWMWWLIIQEMPQHFSFLEIGVFRGQILSLIKLIADMQGKTVTRYGITPLSTEGGVWESDYVKDIETIHDKFNLKKDYIIMKGSSTESKMIYLAQGLSLDLLYIDGCHTKQCTENDIINYSPMIKKGGYLIIDDSGCGFHMPFGYFQGIDTVCEAVDSILPPFKTNPEYEHLFNVVHNRIWKKK